MATVQRGTNNNLFKPGIPRQCKPTIQRSQSAHAIYDTDTRADKINKIQSILQKSEEWEKEIQNSRLMQTDENIFKELYGTLCKGNLADNIRTMCNEAGIDLLHTPIAETTDYIISKMVQDYFLDTHKSTPLVKWPEGANIVSRTQQ